MSKFSSLRRLGLLEARPNFDWGDADADLNEYFSTDIIQSDSQLLRSTFGRIIKSLQRRKRYSSMPVVNIGRLAKNIYQGQGVDREILNFLKCWFTDGNKTGCKFILLDAFNNKRAIAGPIIND